MVKVKMKFNLTFETIDFFFRSQNSTRCQSWPIRYLADQAKKFVPMLLAFFVCLFCFLLLFYRLVEVGEISEQVHDRFVRLILDICLSC